MNSTPSMVEYFDPVAAPGAAADPYVPRLDPSRDVAFGMLSNMFTDATNVLADMEGPLTGVFASASFKRYDKGHRRNSSYAIDAVRVEQMAGECDAVVTGLGHCGSCTRATVRDGLNLARAGLPVAVLVTEEFVDAARLVARAGGIPDLPLVVLPHPVAGKDAKFHRALAESIAPLVRQSLVEGRTVYSPGVREPRQGLC